MSTLESGARLCGRFTLVERLGAGGHGEVWRALDERTDSEIALKVLHPAVARSPEAWEALRREHAVAQRLSHPRIVEVGEPLRDEQATVLPMTLATGDLRRLRGEPYTRILPALIEVADALQHAHEQGVIHRDLKPSNVLFDAEGHVVVGDFGVAALDSEPVAGGSPFSMSPQQIAGAVPSPQDDIWGLGSLAYELLSGYPPFYPQADPRLVLEQPVPALLPIHPLPPRLAALIMRMLARDPTDRPASMGAVREELELALRDTLGEPERAAAASGEESRPANGQSASLADSETAGSAFDRDTDLAAGSVLPAPPPEIAIEPSGFGVDAPASTAPPPPRRANAWLAFAVLGAALVAVFVWLPRFAPKPSAPAASAAAPSGAASVPAADAQTAAEAQAAQQRELDAIEQRFAAKLAELERRGAAVWGGPLFAAAKALGADAEAARRAGDLELARDRATTAERRLERVAADAAAALEAQLAEGERALEAGQGAAAQQAFDLALRVEPGNARAQAGRQRAGGVDQWLPVLTDADNAATARDFGRAIGLYERVLRADPQNAAARAGLEQVRTAAGNDAYARAIGDALAALRGGRLDAARAGFARARALRPDAAEVAAGLAELQSALAGRDLTGVKARAEGLEAAERWTEALAEYERLLRADSSLEFARSGRERVAPRVRLATALQTLIDQPTRLGAPEVRAEADRLLAQARAVPEAGPVLRSQVSRLELLLPEYDRPVRLVVESDGETQVSIQRVGDYGGFARRELELRPGRYTLVGTRSGYRDVRREVTLVPGAGPQAVDLRCTEPIQ
jgi:hypothetical protein